MAHRAFYLFLGRIYSPRQQVLHKIFDIKRGKLMVAREVSLSRVTDETFKMYRDTIPDALRDIEDAVLINVLKNEASVFLFFQVSHADIDRVFGVRILAEKPVPEQVVYDMIAEVTNIVCFETNGLALLMQETIDMDSIPSKISIIAECTSITSEDSILFALGLLSLCLMTITPFIEVSKHIQHLILDLVEYEFTLESSLYSDELVDLVSRMCILAGPCAPLDGLSVTFNEIVTITIISNYIKDIESYSKIEPDAPTGLTEVEIQVEEANDMSLMETIGFLLESNTNAKLEDEAMKNTDVAPLLPLSEDIVSNKSSTDHSEWSHSSNKAAFGDHVKTIHLYKNMEPCPIVETNTAPAGQSRRSKSLRSIPFENKVTNNVLRSDFEFTDIVTTRYLALESQIGKSKPRCKSISSEEMRQAENNNDSVNITLIARREYVKWF